MLSLVSDGHLGRREFLRVGTLGLGGLGLPGLLSLRAHASQGGTSVVKDRAVVLLFLDGGPPQMETFDPKMEAPREYRGLFGAIDTKLPGVKFSTLLPRLAGHADKLAIVRNFAHGIHRHGSAMRYFGAGGNPTKAHMSSLYSSVAGVAHPETGMPRNVLVTSALFRSGYKHSTERIAFTGNLPPVYKSFDPAAGGQLLEDMKLSLPGQRILDRRRLLSELDGLKRRRDSGGSLVAMDKFQAQAFDVVLGQATEAFDISKEDPRVLERYDTSHCRFPETLHSNPAFKTGDFLPTTLGQQMVLARRLVEAGCGFVTVRSHGWDMHGGSGPANSNVQNCTPTLATAVDIAASAFIEDLEERGLTDKVLFIITGEFGRTPHINSNGGRGHWGNLCPLVLSGGGLRTGQVIGGSDRDAGTPVGGTTSTKEVFATIMHSLIDVPALRLETGFPPEVLRAYSEGTPMHQLV